MPYYRRKLPNGKIQQLKRIEIPITDEEFIHKVSHGKFEHLSHKAYCVLLYYSAVRKWEALRVTRENFEITDKDIMFDVGQRLKIDRSARLSRITQFFSDGWTIDQVHSWTGLTLAALNQYVGIVDVYKMGQSMTQRMAPLETPTPS